VYTSYHHWALSCQMNPVNIFPPYFSKIHSNIIFPSMPRSSKWSLPFRLSDKILYAFLISPKCATCPTHLTLLFLNIQTVFGEVHKLWSWLCSLPQPPDTSSLLGSNILNTLFSDRWWMFAVIKYFVSQINFKSKPTITRVTELTYAEAFSLKMTKLNKYKNSLHFIKFKTFWSSGN